MESIVNLIKMALCQYFLQLNIIMSVFFTGCKNQVKTFIADDMKRSFVSHKKD